MIRSLVFVWSGFLLSCFGDRPEHDGDDRALCAISADGVISGPERWPCQYLIDRFATLVAESPPPGSYVTADDPVFRFPLRAGEPWEFAFTGPRRWADTTPMRIRQFRANTELHEVGHFWLFPAFYGVAHADTFVTKYGTAAPDWLDEAWAVWAEGAASRTQRFEQMPGLNAPSLRMLVTMRHPERSSKGHQAARVDGTTTSESTTIDPCIGSCDYLPDSLRGKLMTRRITRLPNGSVDTTTTWATRAALDSTRRAEIESKHFYPLAYSLLRYIRETGGEAAVRELLARYRADPTPRVEVFAGLPGLPTTIDAFERGWHAFLAERRPEPE